MKPPVSDTSPPAEAPAPATKPSLMERFKTLLVEYGPLAIGLNFLILGLTVVGFYLAFQLGFQPQSTGARAGTWAAAYGASQLAKPVRFAAVFVLTPLIARIPPVGRFLARNKHKWSF